MCSTPYLPPGFRFHPTDEELIAYYLKRKVSSPSNPRESIIADTNLYKFSPWELPAKASFGDSEWFFFTPRDRKYPNGARPNRTAGSGYWKATGTDKPILNSGSLQCIGVKKALVFYKGHPPKGIKTDWVMHEYRLLDDNNTVPRIRGSMRLDDWVLCRVRQKISIPQKAEASEEQSNISCIPQFNIPFSHKAKILKTNNSLASSSETTAYYPEAPRKVGQIDEKSNKYYFNNTEGFSNPSTSTDTSSYSYEEMSSPLEDVFKSLKRSHSVVSFGEEFPLSPNKKSHMLPLKNMDNSSIFQFFYLPNFASLDTCSDPSP